MRYSIVAGLLGASALLSLAGEAMGHELFLKMDRYYVHANTEVALTTFNGTFDESVGPVARNRMRDVSIQGASGRVHPAATDWSDVNNQSRLTLRTSAAGTYVAGVSTEYTVSERSADEFVTYLKLEGIPDLLAKYDKSAYPQGVRYRYSKHARAIFQVGEAPSGDYARSLDYPVEIILMSNPSQLKTGDRVRFKAVYKAGALANQLVSVGHGVSGSTQGPDGKSASRELRTDAKGMAEFVIDRPAVWYIHYNRMEPSQTPGFHFESDRASLTFQVR